MGFWDDGATGMHFDDDNDDSHQKYFLGWSPGVFILE
jgi:hypothetical protein